ncbi:glycosyltransferase [Streptococcus suis]|uniref:Glycosyltransferase n=1 Tax=Streptococcus suis TaxID=1307 RepID=A0A1C9IGQ6_STRSU|nr:Glycosyltransferase [Streptococcus suis]HEL1996358.1 glycosyltransferase [Streptococcus suis]HEM5093819.1 glycosyltransferase [Streptococcus suis]HEM5117499.1 glycosyltransferase [Streptococcus suis]HEP1805348.1 glycosyltransferase [Streptococcus suis]
MNSQAFSVSMCVYGKDNPEWFNTAVESILNQSVRPSEVILVVDGPVPVEIDAVINKYATNHIFKIIRFHENQGHGNARRAGLKACTNEIVAIMDADDISIYDRFEKQLAVFQSHPELDVVGGNITEFVGNEANVVGRRIVPCEDTEIKNYLKKRCPMNLVTVMFKKSSIDNAGGFVDWYCEEDYYLWVRMALMNMKFANVPDNLVNVRVGDDMYNRRGGKKYFKSEVKLQKYMLNHKMIGAPRYMINVVERLVLQVLMPNKLRGLLFQKLARSK